MGTNISTLIHRSSSKTNYYGSRNLPDENEVDRIQVQHHYAREAWGGNFSSPVKDVLNAGGATVLDVGCGPGTFLCEMAADYPKSCYIGVDLFPIFPNIKPYNVDFIRCNFLKGLPFEENTFDFVHMRFLIMEFSEFDWENFVLKELTRVLKPNGWIEIMEPRIALVNPGPTTERMINAIQTRAISHKINPHMVDKFEELMRLTNNLKNIQYQVKELPCGKWAGKEGELGAMFVHEILQRHLQYIKNIRPNDHDTVLNNFLQEIDTHRTCFEFYRYFAQKI